MNVRQLAGGEIFTCHLASNKMASYREARLAFRVVDPKATPCVYEVCFPSGTHILHTRIGEHWAQIFRPRSGVYFFLADQEDSCRIRTLVPTIYDFLLTWVEDELPDPFDKE